MHGFENNQYNFSMKQNVNPIYGGAVTSHW